jgi:hypothetical protein
MRTILAFLIMAIATVGLHAQDSKPGRRYGIEPDLKKNPQGTPREALASVVRAVESKQFDYLLAQLVDPPYIDQRVQDNGGHWDELVKEATKRLNGEPVKLLRRFHDEGTWKAESTPATVSLADVAGQTVTFRKGGDRWFMENRK